MRRTLLLIALPLTSAFLIPSTFYPTSLSRYLPQSLQQQSSPLLRDNTHRQSPIMSPVGPVDAAHPPKSGPRPDDSTASTDSDLTISDILPLSRSVNIFAQLTRDIASVTSRLSTIDSANTTLLAPLNSAMQNLPRKPWEDRPDDASGVKAQHNEGKAAENLQRFVEMHVVPLSPWRQGEKVETLGGAEVWWEETAAQKEGEKVRIVKGKGWEMEVAEVLGKVGNGEVWAVKGVVNYE